MNTKELIALVQRLDVASTEMLNWLQPGGRLISREHRDDYAVAYARVAGHLANELMALAEGRVK